MDSKSISAAPRSEGHRRKVKGSGKQIGRLPTSTLGVLQCMYGSFRVFYYLGRP